MISSAKERVAVVTGRHPKIDLLVNNAGVMYPPRQTTRDGRLWAISEELTGVTFGV